MRAATKLLSVELTAVRMFLFGQTNTVIQVLSRLEMFS